MKIEFAKYSQSDIQKFRPQSSSGYPNGNDNLFPDYLDALYNGSVTHAGIINDQTDYIVAQGLVCDDEESNAILQKHLPKHKVHKLVKLDRIHSAKTIEVIKNGLFDIKELNIMLPKQFRVDKMYKQEAQSFIFRKNWNPNNSYAYYIKDLIPVYKPGCKLQKSLFYSYDSGTFAVPYGRPYYMSGLNAIEMEAQIYQAHNSGLSNGNYPSIIYDFEQSGDEAADSKASRDIVKSQGGTKAFGKPTIIQRPAGSNPVNITVPPTTGIDKVYNLQYETSQAGIMVAHGLPSSSLVSGINKKASLFTDAEKELEWAMEQYRQKIILPYREQFLMDLEPLFDDLGIKGEVKFEEVEDKKNSASRFNEFGTGGITGIVQITSAVASGEMSEKAAVATLELVYGLSNEDAMRIATNGIGEAASEPIKVSEDLQVNDALKGLTGQEMQQLNRTLRQYEKGQLTRERAKLLIKEAYGLTDEKADMFLDSAEKLSKTYTVYDLIELGEDEDEEWVEVLRTPYDEALEAEYDKDLEEAFKNAEKFVSTGTAFPNASSEDDGTKGEVQYKVRYRYEGTKPAEREFCRAMLSADKLYRKEDIERMSTANAQFAPKGQSSYSIFEWKGGVYCHHFWERVTFVRRGLEGSIDVRNPNAQTLTESQADERGMRPNIPRIVGVKPINTPTRGRLNFMNIFKKKDATN